MLHLIEPAGGSMGSVLACRAATRILTASHETWMIGDASMVRRCADAGVMCSVSIAPPLRRPHLAWASLRERLRFWLEAPVSCPSIIMAWSVEALALACAAMPRTGPSNPPCAIIGATAIDAPPDELTTLGFRWRLRSMQRRPLITLSGVSPSSWIDVGFTDVRPIPLPALDPPKRRGPAPIHLEPGEHAVALLADPPPFGDARRFAFISGLLGVGGNRCVGVVPAGCSQERRGARFVRECDRAWRILVSDAPIEHLLPHCSAAICDVKVRPAHPLELPHNLETPQLTCGPVSLQAAINAGVPVVIPQSPLSRAFSESTLVRPVPHPTVPRLASALWSAMLAHDNPLAPRPPAAPADPSPFTTTLDDIWAEAVRRPLPGFPLTHDQIPPAPAPRPPLAHASLT